jgi:hypothetical protein
MMHRRFSHFLCCFTLLLGGLSTSGTALGAAAVEIPLRQASYQADAVLQLNQREIPSRVYHHNGKERREFQLGGVQQIFILQPERNRIVYLLPLMKVGMELTLKAGEAFPDLAVFASLKPRKLGREEIGGLWTTKYDVERLKAKEPYTLTLWLTDDGIPVQAEASESSGDYRLIQSNIRRGPQDAALFEVPNGFKLAPVDAETLRGILGN